MTDPASLILAVEDEPSAAVARRLVRTYRKDVVLARVIVARGYGKLRVQALSYNAASVHTPFFLLTDLDRGECAPGLVENWLGGRPREASFLFRVAVREVEAWLIADQAGIAKLLGIEKVLVPTDVEGLPDPKRTLVDLARHSSLRDLRRGLVPAEGSTAQVGPSYVDLVADFAERRWNPERARRAAPSLDAAIAALAGLCRERRSRPMGSRRHRA
ncbi:MAG TPA: hypothetical protein PLP50_13990 [Thermoanaerobaculia bacterium]|mgnify:CR=1 FL=1|nr:hypothetical protein [Thermoanaerobaculia bacterium]HQN08933.1 hypothetical protein [Thermoanaerobaculia bacterium]HQP88353.1 hypothetical protein [Thermoanaerobaculia bacterium]